MTYATRRRATRLRPWALWFALFVAWVGAIVPTVSHALAWSQGGTPDYLAICSAAGPGAAKADTPNVGDPSGKGQSAAGAMLHCPFCLHASDRFAPPPEPIACGLLLHDQPHNPITWQARPFSLPRYARSSPRGPPSFS